MSTRNMSGYIFVVQEVVKFRSNMTCLYAYKIGSSPGLICWCDDLHPDPRSQWPEESGETCSVKDGGHKPLVGVNLNGGEK